MAHSYIDNYRRDNLGDHFFVRVFCANCMTLDHRLHRIEEHPGGEHGRTELAKCCHLSEDHFGRLFRERVGCTPAQYVFERRIAAATQALLFTNDSIDQITGRLGFANRYHLTRMFSRRMGIPPAAYRRTRRV